MKKLMLFLILLAAVVAAFFAVRGISAYIASKQVEPMEFTFAAASGSVAAAEPLVEYNKNYGVALRFPSTGDSELDATIRQDVDAMAQDFRAELGDYQAESMTSRASIMMDFEAASQGKALSVVYHITKKLPQDNATEERVKTFVYDTESARAIHAQDLFEDAYLTIASDFVKTWFAADEKYKDRVESAQFTEHVQPKWENFSAIGFQDPENLTLIFDRGTLFNELVSVQLPLKRVYDAMKLNLTGYEPPKLLVDPDKPMVALSFDDGPYAPVTTRILDALEKVGGRATFFVLGERVKGSEEVMKRAIEMGCVIGNHSYDHANLAKLNPAGIKKQIDDTNALIKQAVGHAATLVRAPYGSINQTVRDSVGAPLINWSIDTLDWKTKDPDKIVPEILNHVSDGDIVLMHDIYKTSAAAAERVIPELVKRGYQLVTVEELMEARGVTMVAGKTYSQAYKK